MDFTSFLKNFSVENNKIVYGMKDGYFVFATLLKDGYLRNIKEINAQNGFIALKEYTGYVLECGYKIIYKTKNNTITIDKREFERVLEYEKKRIWKVYNQWIITR